MALPESILTPLITIPADIPLILHEEFRKNYRALTHGTHRLFLFAADHKIEHLDADFYGPGVASEAHHPQHIFNIASNARIGALATQFGLIARYGKAFPDINYVIKLNSKTNLIPAEQKDPFSKQLWSVEDVVTLKETSGLLIRGVGLTIYLGSEYEDLMLEQAAQMVFKAHQSGLVATLWIYPRGKAVKHATDATLLAGAAGLANCLGADFVKLQPPTATAQKTSAELLQFIAQAAGNTKVICAGGTQHASEQLFQEVRDQLSIGGIAGAAIGRNIWQHSLNDAIKLANELSAIIYD